MKAKINLPTVRFWCPGCECNHSVPYVSQKPVPADSPAWFFDGNTESPTIEPSLRIFTRDGKESDCHVVITAGVLNFCGDCKHQFAGKSIPMQDIKT